MSEDQNIPSFGDPNAQPPTPRQTPTSAGFPHPVFGTPENNQHSFEGSSGWTPRFAEEFSLFNSTPGNLRASHGAFVDFSASTPYQPSDSSHKRLLSSESLATELSSHVIPFSPNPSLPLPPLDPSRRLLSSPASLGHGSSPVEAEVHVFTPQKSKKFKTAAPPENQAQTATPPPSAPQGGRRRLAPKLQTETMQNEEFEQDFAAGTPQQQHMPNFAATPVDMYGVPLPMPATAPVYTDSRIFWDNDMGGMDLDFSGVGTAMFQHPTHRPVTSLDWGKSSDIPQDSSVAPSQLRQTQENHPPPRKERMLAPKPPASSADLGMTDTAMFAASFPTHVEDTLGMLGSCGGVDPGLLFTQAPPLGMDSMTVDPMAQQPLLQPLSVPEPIPVTMKEPKRGQVRRSASGKKRDSSKKIDRASASSPIKSSSGHAGLSRSSSENKGRRPAKRPILPNLAPAVPQGPTSSTSTRPAAQGSGANGRRSPKKHQHRLSSLASIPERSPPRTRTSVKFTIDSRGRARAETTVTVDGGGGQAPAMLRRHPDESSRSKKWDSSEEESSSSDDEPIVIPSRNSSFAMPQPRKPALAHSLNASQGSFGELNNASSLGIYHNEPAAASSQNEVESEAETVLNVPSGAGGRRGDATSELRKVRESRQKKVAALNTNHHYSSGPPYSAGSTMSPTTLTDASLPTPLTDGGNQIRCVCHTTQSHINGDGYMVQCEACEMWLHGKCINITRQTLPCVYICAFCANTPNAHRMRGQDVRRSMGVPNMGASAASPLAHKSFKSFR